MSSPTQTKSSSTVRAPRVVDNFPVQRCGALWVPIDIPQSHLTRLLELRDYWTKERLELQIVPLINREKNTVSLRVLEWLVTNYAKKNKVAYMYQVSETKAKLVDVAKSYKIVGDVFRREMFDIFRRKIRNGYGANQNSRIYFGDNCQHWTTIAQVNFLHWAYTEGVVAYARKALKSIKQDMAENANTTKTLKRRRDAGEVVPKRKEISKRPDRTCFVYGEVEEVFGESVAVE